LTPCHFVSFSSQIREPHDESHDIDVISDHIPACDLKSISVCLKYDGGRMVREFISIRLSAP